MRFLWKYGGAERAKKKRVFTAIRDFDARRYSDKSRELGGKERVIPKIGL